MTKFISKRLVNVVITLFIASIIIFTLTEVMPGDVAQMILGQYATPESLEALRAQLGLDKSPVLRYRDWIWGVLHGDLGTSLSMKGVSISSILIRRGRNSLFLAVCATVFLVPLSLVLGVIAGLKEGSWLDHIISTSSLIALSMPSFISGTFLMLIFAVWLKIVPAMSSIEPGANLFSVFPRLILPIVTVSLVLLGYVARMVRASVIDASHSDYARTAVLKGLPRIKVVWHILRNALMPTVTVIAMNLGWLIGGLVIVETLFAYPGLGRLVYVAIQRQDIPMIQASVLLTSAVYLLLNLASDIIYTFLDPRIRY
ncbi:MAG: ABC transporter permease [Candidatus Bipolaricaulota bacterium]|nr:ABC transporter permease [Candidatus Bipolaricaulota bacterium]